MGSWLCGSSASSWRSIESATTERGQIDLELQQLQLELHRLQRWRRSLPAMAAKQLLRAERAALGAVIRLAPEATAEREVVERELGEVAARLQLLQRSGFCSDCQGFPDDFAE